MAMNKSEQAALELALTRAALTWPPVPNPSPLTLAEVQAHPEPIVIDGNWSRKVMRAWFYNAYTQRVSQGWVAINGTIHASDDPHLQRYYVAQGIGRAYRSFEEAKAALWWDKAMMCANSLRKIELMQPENKGTNS